MTSRLHATSANMNVILDLASFASSQGHTLVPSRLKDYASFLLVG